MANYLWWETFAISVPFQVHIWRLQFISLILEGNIMIKQPISSNVKDRPWVQAQNHPTACPILLARINTGKVISLVLWPLSSPPCSYWLHQLLAMTDVSSLWWGEQKYWLYILFSLCFLYILIIMELHWSMTINNFCMVFSIVRSKCEALLI